MFGLILFIWRIWITLSTNRRCVYENFGYILGTVFYLFFFSPFVCVREREREKIGFAKPDQLCNMACFYCFIFMKYLSINNYNVNLRQIAIHIINIVHLILNIVFYFILFLLSSINHTVSHRWQQTIFIVGDRGSVSISHRHLHWTPIMRKKKVEKK